jgi:hypothetical protein
MARPLDLVGWTADVPRVPFHFVDGVRNVVHTNISDAPRKRLTVKNAAKDAWRTVRGVY